MIRDLSLAANALVAPRVVLFDWHATLVDTLDAMYHAVDDVLPQLPALGLMDELLPPERSRSAHDGRLVEYVSTHLKLHPKIKADRKISRTDIFEILFGDNEDAVKLGILTNRDREFFEHEFAIVEDGAWLGLFDTTICGGDTFRRKPNPEPIRKALVELKELPGPACWYVGDSATDVAAARRAEATAIFFNGAGWDSAWLDQVFPGTPAHPHQPHAIVNSFAEFKYLFEAVRARAAA